MLHSTVNSDPSTRHGGQLKIIASIEEPQVIAKILSHLERAAPEQYQSELPLSRNRPRYRGMATPLWLSALAQRPLDGAGR